MSNKNRQIIFSLIKSIVFLLIPFQLFAQNIDTTVTFYCGGSTYKVFDMVTDKFGNTFSCGRYNGDLEFTDGSFINGGTSFLIKHDSSGNILWKKHWSTSNLTNIDTDTTGNIYIAGTSPLSGEPIFNGFGPYCFIAKLDSSGSFIWAKPTPTPTKFSIENSQKISMAFHWEVDGYFFGNYLDHSWLGAKLVYGVADLDGNLLWYNIDNNQNITYNLSTARLVNGIFAKNDKFIIFGEFNNALSFLGNSLTANGYENYYAIIDINNSSVVYADKISGNDVFIKDMELDNNGKVYFGVNHQDSFSIAGQTISSSIYENAQVGTLNNQYQIDWIYNLGGETAPQQGDITLSSICLSNNNHLISIGDYKGIIDFNGLTFNSDPIYSGYHKNNFISVINHLGSMKWAMNIGGEGTDYALHIDALEDKLILEGLHSVNLNILSPSAIFYGVGSTYITTIKDENISYTQPVNLGNDTSFCLGDSLLLNVASPGASYFWQDGSNDSTYLITQPGTYWVYVTNNFGTTTDTIVVSPNNIISDFISSNNGNGNYLFTNTSSGSYNQVHWAFGDGNTSFTSNPNHTFSTNGTFPVLLTVNDSTLKDNCRDYSYEVITVTDALNTLQCSAGYVIYPTSNNIVTVVNSSFGSNLSCFWDFGDGNTSTQLFPSHSYSSTGPFNLCLTVDDGSGCIDTYCDSIGINGVVFLGSFSINVVKIGELSIANNKNNNEFITIYPNPVAETINVECNDYEIQEIEIIDISGKTLKIIKHDFHQINVNNLPSGIYYLKFETEDKTVTKKFVKI